MILCRPLVTPDWENNMRAALVAVMLVLLAGPVAAGPFEDGLSAYNRQDYATALRTWRPLADQGDSRAQHNLGYMYENGKGVPKDNVQAVTWYRLAAEQGEPHAQTNLGYMYASGKGVPKDDVLAYMWSNLGAAEGIETAAKNRDTYAVRMSHNQIAEAQRLSREWKPK
jgi:TPR repeat protein